MTDTSGAPSAPPSPPSDADRRGDILAFGALGLLALVIFLGFGLVIFKAQIDGATGTLITEIVAAVISIATVVYSFQFGSSKGSQDKNAQIAALTPPPTPPAP